VGPSAFAVDSILVSDPDARRSSNRVKPGDDGSGEGSASEERILVAPREHRNRQGPEEGHRGGTAAETSR
jgi:hypothetical protein